MNLISALLLAGLYPNVARLDAPKASNLGLGSLVWGEQPGVRLSVHVAFLRDLINRVAFKRKGNHWLGGVLLTDKPSRGLTEG